MKRLFITLALLCVLALPVAPQTNTLATLAATMKPGTFALLNQDGDGSDYGAGLLCYDGVGCSFAFSRKAVYDPTTDRVHHIGAPHSGTTHHIQYDVATNRWTTLTGNPHTGHTHGSVAMYPTRRELHAFAGDTGWLQDMTTSQWRQIAVPPRAENFGSWEYFPDRDELLHVGTRALSKWDRTTNTWTVIADETVLSGMQTHFNEARYNPIHKAVLLVGGYNYAGMGSPDSFSHALYKYDQNGVVTRLQDSPPPINTGSNTGLVTVDPVSGEFLFLNSVLTPTGGYEGRFTFFAYNWTTEEWTDKTAIFPTGFSAAEGNVFASLTVSVPKYGVTLWMSASGMTGGSKVYVYKHGAGSGPAIDTLPPSTPGGLTAVPVSSSQINLAWSASTDNISVSGYKIYQDGAHVGSTTAPSYSATGLTSGVSYSFAVSAMDEAGNSSPLSSPVSATTQTSGGGSTSTFEQKCQQPGVLGCWSFDDESELKYSWDPMNEAVSKVLAGKTWHSMSYERGPAEGNVFALQHVGGALSIPIIDKTVFSSGVGSLKFTIPSQSEPQSGWFQDNFNKVLGNPSMYIAPGSPHGNVIWLQYRFRPSDTMLTNVYRQFWKEYSYQLSTSAAGATRITLPPEYVPAYYSFAPEMVGRLIALQGPNPLSPWVKGIYAITGYVDAGTVILDRSPTPTAAGSQGVGTVGSPDTADYRAGGWKLDIIFGNSPNVGSSGAASVVTMDPAGLGFPIMYGQQGYDSYGWQDKVGCNWGLLDPSITYNRALYTEPPCKRFKPNDWITITKRVEVRGAPGDPASRVQLWVDGTLVVDYGNAKVFYGQAGYADGLGQFDLSVYHTRKDPTQIHADAYVWFDDVITSTQPIAMDGGGGTTPPPPVNTAPAISAISNQTVTAPASATFTATVTDDGLPNGTLTYQWSGAGVTFSAPTGLTTQATAPSGSYTVTFNASDGALNAVPRTATLTVNAAPAPGDTVAPVVAFKTLNNSTFTSNAKLIELTVSDNVGVVSCQPTVNGIAIQATPIFTTGAKLPATVKFYIQQAAIPKATYVLAATCKDAAGNTGTAPTISVIRK